MRESTWGTAFVAVAAAGFGTIGIFGEVAAAIDLRLATLLPVRFAIATLVVGCLAVLRRWPVPASPRRWLATLSLGVVYTLMTLCFFLSLRYLTAGLATIVLYTYPTFVVALSAFVLDESVTGRKLFALGLATSGVVLVVGTGGASVDLSGVVLALGAAACYAVYTTGSRHLSPDLAPRALMLGILAGTTASMLVYGALDGGLTLPSGQSEWGVVLGLAVVSTVVPHLLFYEGVSRLEAGRVGVVSTIEPVVTVVLGALLLGEAVTLAVVVGGIFVLGGVLVTQSAPDEPETLPEAATPHDGTD